MPRLSGHYHCQPGDGVDCAKLARLVLKHQSGDYYVVADRLATQLKLQPRHKLRLRRLITHYTKLKKR